MNNTDKKEGTLKAISHAQAALDLLWRRFNDTKSYALDRDDWYQTVDALNFSKNALGGSLEQQTRIDELEQCLREIITEKELHGQVVDGTMKARRLLSTEDEE